METVSRSALSRHRAAAWLAVVAAVTVVTVAGLPTPSSAHNAVVETTPEAGATVASSPVKIRIVTSDTLLDLGGVGAGFAIAVQDAKGFYFGDGCVKVGTTDFTTAVDLGGGGDYTVTYQFVSADGHSLSDSFSFRFDPTSDQVAADGVVDPPVCSAAESTGSDSTNQQVGSEVTVPSDTSPTVSASPVDDARVEDTDQNNGAITAAIAGVLIVLSITLLLWMVRRRNRG